MAPRGTPKPIIARLNAEIAKAIADPQLVALLAKSGVQTAGGPPEVVTERIKAETEVVRPLVAKLGLKPE